MSTRKKLFYICFFIFLITIVCIDLVSQRSKTVLQSVQAPSELPQLIIDAGHGGEDCGAIAQDGTYEKDLNLSIALCVNDFAKLFGFDTVMTRSQDTALGDLSLETIRKRKMSDINARLQLMTDHPKATFVSIHQNHYADRSCNGMQVFYSDNNAKSRHIAECIQEYTVSKLQKENKRTTKAITEDVYLLYHAQNPAVLVECGFLSNHSECNNLKDARYATKLSMCILSGLLLSCYAERNS